MFEADSLELAIHEPVRIRPYDPSWPSKFSEEKTRLSILFQGAFLSIEHIGSTAVPSLGAKPVIDLMAGVGVISEADAILPALCENGYTTSAEFNATLTDQRWLMKYSGGHRTHHLHLMIFESKAWRERIEFREILRADPDTASRYYNLKLSLAEALGSDREAYGLAKTEFIEKVLSAARPA